MPGPRLRLLLERVQEAAQQTDEDSPFLTQFLDQEDKWQAPALERAPAELPGLRAELPKTLGARAAVAGLSPLRAGPAFPRLPRRSSQRYSGDFWNLDGNALPGPASTHTDLRRPVPRP